MSEEARIADQIVSVLPAGSAARLLTSDEHSIRYVVEHSSLKLRSVIFSRSSLRKLESDPARAVKIDYLRRDLLRSAVRRAEFRYPRLAVVQRIKRLVLRRAQAACAVV